MQIESVKYGNSDNDGVILCFIDGTTFIIPTQTKRYKHTDLFNEWLDNGGVIQPFKTNMELETQRKTSITTKATEIIEARYSPLKQRKLSSIYLGILEKMINSDTLSSTELQLKRECNDADNWIKAIRTIEKDAITNGTALQDIDWNVI